MSTPKPKRWRISRRGFLIGAGTTGAALALGWIVGLPRLRLALSDVAEGTEKAFSRGAPKAAPTQWFIINPDNSVELHIQKIEMGQGIHTALGQIAADELDIPWENLRVVAATTGSAVDDPNGTGNSESVVSHYLPLRNAAATLRDMLRADVATKWGVEASTLIISDGVISHNDKSITFGEVVAQHQGEWQVPEGEPTLKSADQFRYIGQPQARVDLPDKIIGKAGYGHDMRLPNMLWGVVARPTQIGATIASVDPKDAASMPGVVSVIVEDQFVAVAAENKSQAATALGAMQITWNTPQPLLQQADIDRATTVQSGSGVVIQTEGEVDWSSDGVIRREFRTPMAVHAHLEPQAALVDVKADSVEAWVSTQVPVGLHDAIAGALGRDKAQVKVHPVYLGGGFGRRLEPNLGVEAARLSQAAGRPVYVSWNRAEEFRNGFVRPPTHHVMQGKVSADGTIEAIEHHFASGDVLLTIFPPAVGTLLGWDIGAARGAKLYYTATQGKRTIGQRVALPVATSFWRGLGLLANGFAIESLIDEMAHTVGMDPLAFRLKNLPDTRFGQRMKRTLQAAADAAGWGTPLPAGRARGLACSADAGTCVAQVAEISIVDNQIRVHHVYAAVDAGLVINPTGVQTQTEGGIVMGIGSTLIEQLTVVDGAFSAFNFDKYPLLRNSQSPDITVVITGGEDDPGGMGEPPIGPVAGAVANAVFALTGQRLTSLPLQLPA
jgi:isoquinoline 1-oxidoreductase beta subunit